MKRLISCCLLVALVSNLLVSPYAHAQTTTSPWLSSDLALSSLEVLGTNDVIPISINGNRDCQMREVITRPAVPFTKQSYQSCVYDTILGAIAQNGYLQRPSSTTWGEVRNPDGMLSNLIGVPHSQLTLLGDNAGLVRGTYIGFVHYADQVLTSTVIFDNSVRHTFSGQPDAWLRDKAGNKIAIMTDSLSFSDNGNWMVADLPNIGMARINLNTYEVLPFGDAINYDAGLAPSYQTAISPNGRYAVVGSSTFNTFQLYDLSNCSGVPNTITKKVGCASVNLLPVFQQKIPGFFAASRFRFHGEHALDFYTGARPTGTLIKTHQLLMPSGFTDPGFQYLGLGDSFASGEGAYQYKSFTDTGTNKCHLSQRSYPYLLSNVLNFSQYESVACSGAKIQDLVDTYPDYDEHYAQSKGRQDKAFNDEIFTNYLPGYREQKLFTIQNHPNTITLSAGGNDIGFSDKIKRCIDTDTCYSSYEDRLEIVNEINAQFYRLTDMYNQLKASLDPHARIYVIGYPQIADPNGNCALNVHFNHDELIFAQQLISYLNSVIKTATANAGVFYVDTEDAFTGARMCEADSWNVAVNGLTIGNDQPGIPLVSGPIANESFHPNALGHRLLSDKILQQTNNLTIAMPAPNPSAVVTDPPPGLALLHAPKSNRVIRKLQKITGTNGGVLKTGQAVTIQYSGLGALIKAGSFIKAELHSSPYDLGSYSLGSDGTLTLNFNLPDSFPTGIHTIHLYAQNTSNELMDFYETVFVGTDACNALGISGLDTDKDAIDDSCDGMITQAPLLVESPPSVSQPEIPQIHTETQPISPNTVETPTIQPTVDPVEDSHPQRDDGAQYIITENQDGSVLQAGAKHTDTIQTNSAITSSVSTLANNLPQILAVNTQAVLGASTQPPIPQTATSVYKDVLQPVAKPQSRLKIIILSIISSMVLLIFSLKYLKKTRVTKTTP